MGKRRRPRVDQNEHLATIESLSHDGRGIARIDGKITFLFNALPGEEVKFRYTRQKSQFDEGSVTEVIKASPDRQVPACPHFGVCGGCGLQHCDSELQLSLKSNAVLELLGQQGVTPLQLSAPLQSPPTGYRRKARLGAKYILKKSKPVIGFRERGNALITDISTCKVLDARVGEQIETLKEWLSSLDARCDIPQLEVAATDDCVAIVIRHLKPLSDPDLTKITQLGEHLNYRIYLQPGGMETIQLFYPQEGSLTLSYQLPKYGLHYEFHPSQFTQINETINQKMIHQAIDWLDLKSNDHVLDLFCGIGNFSLPISQFAEKVIGVEGDHSAVEQAKHNAHLNNRENCTFHTANLFDDCKDMSFAQQQFDKILLDPPRSGAQEVLMLMPQWRPQSIVYVSCNPATFARDAAILQKHGYTLDLLGMMDMFPHTQHIEVMGRFNHEYHSH